MLSHAPLFASALVRPLASTTLPSHPVHLLLRRSACYKPALFLGAATSSGKLFSLQACQGRVIPIKALVSPAHRSAWKDCFTPGQQHRCARSCTPLLGEIAHAFLGEEQGATSLSRLGQGPLPTAQIGRFPARSPLRSKTRSRSESIGSNFPRSAGWLTVPNEVSDGNAGSAPCIALLDSTQAIGNKPCQLNAPQGHDSEDTWSEPSSTRLTRDGWTRSKKLNCALPSHSCMQTIVLVPSCGTIAKCLSVFAKNLLEIAGFWQGQTN